MEYNRKKKDLFFRELKAIELINKLTLIFYFCGRELIRQNYLLGHFFVFLKTQVAFNLHRGSLLLLLSDFHPDQTHLHHLLQLKLRILQRILRTYQVLLAYLLY